MHLRPISLARCRSVACIHQYGVVGPRVCRAVTVHERLDRQPAYATPGQHTAQTATGRQVFRQISDVEIQKRVTEIGAQITKDYKEGDLIMIGIGGFTPLEGFMARADWEGSWWPPARRATLPLRRAR